MHNLNDPSTVDLTGAIYLDIGSALPRATGGAAEASPAETSTNKVNYQYMDFDPDTAKYVQWRLRLPHDYNGGTIQYAVDWGAASGSGIALFDLQAVAIGNGEALDAAFGAAVEVADTLIATADMHRTPVSDPVTIAGTPAADKTAFVQLFRNAAETGDTLTTNARVQGVIIYYTKKSN